MKNLFTIKYTVVGGKRTDFVDIFSKSITEAISRFEELEFDVSGIKVKYNQD